MEGRAYETGHILLIRAVWQVGGMSLSWPLAPAMPRFYPNGTAASGYLGLSQWNILLWEHCLEDLSCYFHEHYTWRWQNSYGEHLERSLRFYCWQFPGLHCQTAHKSISSVDQWTEFHLVSFPLLSLISGSWAVGQRKNDKVHSRWMTILLICSNSPWSVVGSQENIYQMNK